MDENDGSEAEITATMWAEVRRELIAEANRQGWTAESVRGLLMFAEASYETTVLGHPAFPKGVLVAYTAHGGQ